MNANHEGQSRPIPCTNHQEGESKSFVVRIWLEEAATQNRPTLWRGHITHVVSNTRRYFQELGAVTDFIAPYLRAWEIESEPIESDE